VLNTGSFRQLSKMMTLPKRTINADIFEKVIFFTLQRYEKKRNVEKKTSANTQLSIFFRIFAVKKLF
jgi:hypothetical protein